MEYRKIEHLVYNQNLINPSEFDTRKEYMLRLDKMLIDNLQKCIDKHIPIEMNEIEFSKIYKVYLKLIKNNYPLQKDFLINLANLSVKKLDYLGIIQEICE